MSSSKKNKARITPEIWGALYCKLRVIRNWTAYCEEYGLNYTTLCGIVYGNKVLIDEKVCQIFDHFKIKYSKKSR